MNVDENKIAQVEDMFEALRGSTRDQPHPIMRPRVQLTHGYHPPSSKIHVTEGGTFSSHIVGWWAGIKGVGENSQNLEFKAFEATIDEALDGILREMIEDVSRKRAHAEATVARLRAVTPSSNDSDTEFSSLLGP